MHGAMATGTGLLYLLIVAAIPFLHSDDCTAAHGTGTAGMSCSSDEPCPACKFLSASNATEVPCGAGPVLMQSGVPREFAPDLFVVIASPCVGSILLRGPPVSSLL